MFTEAEILELEIFSELPIISPERRQLFKRLAQHLRSHGVPAEGEPVFSVLARDEFYQATVLFWMGRAKAAGVNPEKIARASKRYREGIEWQSDNPNRVKRPD